MNRSQAINNFWSSFGIEAYDASSVPENAQLPRITFDYAEGEFNYSVAASASIWYRDTSWESITNKAKEISDKISRGGIMVPTDDGGIWIIPGSPFLQRMADPDPTIRRIMLNVYLEFI